MQVRPLTPVLGADVTGIDVMALDDGAFGALREVAWDEAGDATAAASTA